MSWSRSLSVKAAGLGPILLLRNCHARWKRHFSDQKSPFRCKKRNYGLHRENTITFVANCKLKCTDVTQQSEIEATDGSGKNDPTGRQLAKKRSECLHIRSQLGDEKTGRQRVWVVVNLSIAGERHKTGLKRAGFCGSRQGCGVHHLAVVGARCNGAQAVAEAKGPVGGLVDHTQAGSQGGGSTVDTVTDGRVGQRSIGAG